MEMAGEPLSSEDFLLRLWLLENDRLKAQETYAKNPFDSDNLAKWGKTLLELSKFVDDQESKAMIKVAITKLEEALQMDSSNHEASFDLGNTYKLDAYLSSHDSTGALVCLDKATECFQKAVDEDPQNELYVKSLDDSTKAPVVFMELLKDMLGQQQTHAPSEPSSTTANGNRENKRNELMYDLGGWIIFGLGIMAWLGFRPPVPPPSG